MADYGITIQFDTSQVRAGVPETTAGMASVEAATKSVTGASQELAQQYRILRESIDPSVRASTELAAGSETLFSAMRAGIAPMSEVARLMELQTAQLEAQIAPFDAYLADLETETNFMRLSASEREVQTKLLAAENELRAQGVLVTSEQTAALLEQLRAQQAIKLEQAEANAVGETRGLGGALGGKIGGLVIGGLAVGELAKLGDEVTLMQNKLRALYPDENQAAAGLEKLYDAAQHSRTSWEGTVTVFSRLKQATEDLNVSQDQLVAITQTLNEAAVVSGVSNQEATRAILDLTHGVAQGHVNMRELRQVMAQMPAVTDVLTEHFHTNREGLIQLAHQGQITGQAVVDAFTEAGPEIEAKFGRTAPTLTQSFTEMKNAILHVLQELAPAFSALATGIEYVAKAIDLVKDHTEAFAFAASFLIPGGQIFRGLDLLTHLAGALDDVIGGESITDMARLREQIEETTSAIDKSRDSFEQWAFLARNGVNVGAITATQNVHKLVEEINALHATTTKIAAERFTGTGEFKGEDNIVKQINREDIDNVRRFNEENKKAEAQTKALTGELQHLYESLGMANKGDEELAKATDLVERAERAHLLTVQEGNDLLQRRAAIIAEQQLAADKTIDQMQSIDVLLKAQNEEQVKELQQALDLSLQAKEFEKSFKEAEEGVKKFTAEFDKTFPAAAKGMTETELGLAEFRKRFLDTSHDIRDALTSAFEQFNTAFINFIDTGEFKWRDFVNNLIGDLERFLLKRAELAAFDAVLSAITPGAGVATAAAGFATGGSFTVGGNGGTDSRLVAFRATPGERVTVTTPGDRGPGGAPIVVPAPSVQVHNHLAATTMDAHLRTPLGKRAILNAIREDPSAVRRALNLG